MALTAIDLAWDAPPRLWLDATPEKTLSGGARECQASVLGHGIEEVKLHPSQWAAEVREWGYP